jgi:hypothetical protein
VAEMTTRLNNGIVEMTNFIIDRFFGLKDGLIKVGELRTIGAWRSFAGIVQLLKFDHLCAHWLFVFEEWLNPLKKWEKLATGKAPQDLVSSIRDMTFIKKVKLSTKSGGCPEEERRFCVIALKLNPVAGIFSIFMERPAYIKTAFGVDISGQVGKVIDRWSNGVSYGFKTLFRRGIDSAIPVFQIVHVINGALLSFFFKISRSVAKFKKCDAFSGFFNEKWKNFGKFLVSFFIKHKMIGRKSIFLFRNLHLDGALKVGRKPFNVVPVSGDNRKSILIERRSFNLSKIETAIPINIASSVREIGAFLHAA